MASAVPTLAATRFQKSPLRHPRFRWLYFGSIGSALGYTMQATIAAWLMATLTPYALMVALPQAVTDALLTMRSLNHVVTSGTLLWTFAITQIAVTHLTAFALLGTFAAGMAWVAVFASLSAGTQSSAPAWVRARAVAMNLVAVRASLAIGSAIWGAFASFTSVAIALGISASAAVVLLALTRRVKVGMGTEADVTPGAQLPELAIAVEPEPEDGPVLIQVEYRVDPQQRAAFLRAIHDVEPTRRRNGAAGWRMFRDLGEDGRFVERFIIDSWAEYVRLRVRSKR